MCCLSHTHTKMDNGTELDKQYHSCVHAHSFYSQQMKSSIAECNTESATAWHTVPHCSQLTASATKQHTALSQWFNRESVQTFSSVVAALLNCHCTTSNKLTQLNLNWQWMSNSYICTTNYTVSQKNDTDVAGYIFNAHQPILIVFGR